MERDYAAILLPLIKPIVHNPDAVLIRELPGATKRDVTIAIIANDDDTARLIGRRGTVANALREVVRIATKADDTNQHIPLTLASLSEGQDHADDAQSSPPFLP